MDKALKRLVRQRAHDACEYCQLPQLVYRARFHIDHIIAEQHGGEAEPSNLALACPRCNLHKGTNISGIDPASHRRVRLFHPRRDDWHRHFRWAGPVLVSRTAIGRATIQVLAINHPRAITVRAELIA